MKNTYFHYVDYKHTEIGHKLIDTRNSNFVVHIAL